MPRIDLVAVLRASGVPTIEHPGARTRGRPGSFDPIGIMQHHDASPRGSSPGNARFIFEQGRPAEGIPAPLSQMWVCLGCNGTHPIGTWHVGAYGRANHGGTGHGWGRIPKDQANTLLYGIEVDHTTGEPVHPELWSSLVTGSAALLNALRSDANNACPGHKDYAGPRKSDPDWDMNAMRRDVGAAQVALRHPQSHTPAPTVQEDDMAQQDVDQLKAQVADLTHKVEALTVLAQQTQDRLGMDVNVDNASRNDLAALSTKLDEVLEHVRAQA